MIAGAALLGMGIMLGLVFRLRMVRLGDWTALFKGGSFDYAEYHRLRVGRGWDTWPVWAMWALYVFGIGLLIAAFFLYFGTQPRGIK